MVCLQTLIMWVYGAIRSPAQFALIARQWRVSLFVGVTSALGSIGWFTAMTVERASYVKALGQIEFVFALVISTLFFRERTTGLELVGMMLVAVAITVTGAGQLRRPKVWQNRTSLRDASWHIANAVLQDVNGNFAHTDPSVIVPTGTIISPNPADA